MKLDTEPEPLSDRSDAYLGLKQAARRFVSQRTGGPVHVSAVLRYMLKGVPTAAGGRIKLAAWRHPGGWVTTEPAIREFIDALTRDRLGLEPAAPPVRTPLTRRREAEKADGELERLRI
jgi:hypothetical protein